MIDTKKVVDRFLSWRLPDDFGPDHFISFDRVSAERQRSITNGNSWPIGTNLFTAEQAKKMFEHCLQDALATAPQDATSNAEGRHPDDVAVDRFAAAMKEKLAVKRAQGRGGWDDPEQCSLDYLVRLFHDHVSKGDPIDIGNFAMMLWNRMAAANLPIKYKHIPSAPPSQQQGVVVPVATPRMRAAAVVCYGEGGIESSFGFYAVPLEDAKSLELELLAERERAEKAETALRKQAGQIGVACDKHDLIHALTCGYCHREAEQKLAALEEALRNPTQEMIDAGGGVITGGYSDLCTKAEIRRSDIKEVFQAMTAHLLKD